MGSNPWDQANKDWSFRRDNLHQGILRYGIGFSDQAHGGSEFFQEVGRSRVPRREGPYSLPAGQAALVPNTTRSHTQGYAEGGGRLGFSQERDSLSKLSER